MIEMAGNCPSEFTIFQDNFFHLVISHQTVSLLIPQVCPATKKISWIANLFPKYPINHLGLNGSASGSKRFTHGFLPFYQIEHLLKPGTVTEKESFHGCFSEMLYPLPPAVLLIHFPRPFL